MSAAANCKLVGRWRIVEAVLARSYRRIAHAAGQVDSYDVYEAVGAADKTPDPQ